MGLHYAGFEAGDDAFEIMVDVVTELCELSCDALGPHNGVGVGQEVYVVVVGELFELKETVGRDANEEASECVVDVGVGDVGPYGTSDFVVKHRRCKRAVFDSGEEAGLDVFAEVLLGIGHTDGAEGLDAVGAADIHNYAAEVEEKIFNHNSMVTGAKLARR